MKRLLVIFRILGALSMIGCGTTHHFLPGQPLERHNWMISFSWHFDINHLRNPRSLIAPEVTAYVGIGKDFNFGFGGYILPSHISLAKYYENGNNKYKAWYGHLMPISNGNPLIESGIQFSNIHDTYENSYSLGVGFGVAPAWGSHAGYFQGIAPNIIPTFKYRILGRDFGFSCINNFGYTSSTVYRSLPIMGNPPDTIINSKADSIINIEYFERPRFGNDEGALRLHFKSDSIVTLYGIITHVDEFVNLHKEMQNWVGGNYGVYWYINYGYIILSKDFGELIDEWKKTGHLVIINYPTDFKKRVDRINPFLIDNSFGVSVFSHSD